jgi:hypothetical protein
LVNPTISVGCTAAPLGKHTRKSVEKNLQMVEKKEQVVETTCESHEKTSKDNLLYDPGKLPVSRIPFPRNEFD